MLLADFEDGQIQVVQLDISNSETTTVVRFSISETEDCYNLLLCGSPVMATRQSPDAVSYTHLRAHETGRNLVCRLLLEKKKKKT